MFSSFGENFSFKEIENIRMLHEYGDLHSVFANCKYIAEDIERNLGYPVVGDAFVLIPDIEAVEHYWNQSPDGIWYLDASADQFNSELEKLGIELVLPEIRIFKKDGKFSQRFYCTYENAGKYVKFSEQEIDRSRHC